MERSPRIHLDRLRRGWTAQRALAVAAGLLGLLLVARSARGSWFTNDDLVFLRQATELPMGWHRLSEPIFDHFSPWHRALDALVVGPPISWARATALTLAMTAGVLAASWALLGELLREHPRHPARIVAFVPLATSAIFQQSGQWWALSAQQLPQLLLGVLAVLAALRWSRTRRLLWLGLALLAYALALAAFIKALLVPLLLFVLLYLLPDAGSRVLRVPGRVWRDRLLWAGVVALTAVYALIVTGDRYYRFIGATPDPTAGQWWALLRHGLLDGVLPLALGQATPATGDLRSDVVRVVAVVVLVVLVVLTARRRPTALLAWAGALVVAVGAIVSSGAARLTTAGVEAVALDPRYNAEGALALLVVGAAVVARTGLGLPDRLRTPRVGAVAAAAALAVVLVAGLSAHGTLSSGWPGQRVQDYVATGSRGLVGKDTTLVDGPVPGYVVDARLVGQNAVSQVVPLALPGVSIGDPRRRPLFASAGPPVPMRGTPEVDASLRELRSSGAIDGVDADGCVAPGGRLTIRIGRDAGLGYHVLTLTTRPPADTQVVSVVQDAGLPTQRVAGFDIPNLQTTPTSIPADRPGLVAVAGFARAAAVRLDLVGGTSPLCVVRAAVVAVRPEGTPAPSRALGR